jgi:LacI family transcriptional regulator, galactose operon repressor
MVGSGGSGVNGGQAMTERPRIGDVARRAGVSVGTVSNALNRPDRVAADTLRRVEAAVDELHYVRNESARTLRSGQSRTIGLIVPDVANPFFTDVARGVEDVTSAAGVLVIVCNSDSGAAKEQRYLRMLAEQQVLGILHVPASDALPSRRRDRGVPLVLLDHNLPAKGACSVAVDDVGGGRLAVSHLLDAGHRRIGFVGYVTDPPSQVIDRLAGARAALRDAGRDRDDLVLVPTASLTFEGGVEAGQAITTMPARRRPTAVACVNDLLAIGVMQQALRAGLRVPDDIAIVGYDDIAFASAAAVPLTSVRQPRNQLGRRAAELLLDETSNARHRHTNVVFEPDLIVRESSH